MEYSAWVLPETDVRNVLPRYTGLKTIHLELLRTDVQGGSKVLEESSSAVVVGKTEWGDNKYGNGRFLGDSSVYDFHPDVFGGVVGDTATLNWLAQNYIFYIDIAAQGEEIKDMLNNGKLNNTVSEIVKYVQKVNAVGIECNLENYAYALTNQEMIQWYKALGDGLRAAGKKLRITVQPMAEKGEDGVWNMSLHFNQFLRDVQYDEVCLMIYDEMYVQNPIKKTSMPSSSFEFIKKNIEQTLSYGVPANKLVAGLAGYGYFCRNNNEGGVEVPTLIQTPELFKAFEPQLKQMTQRDSTSGELYNRNALVLADKERANATPSTPGHIWWSDDEAMKQKMNVVKSLGVNKFSLWVAHRYMTWFEPVNWDGTTPPPPEPNPNPPPPTSTTGSIGRRLNKGQELKNNQYIEFETYKFGIFNGNLVFKNNDTDLFIVNTGNKATMLKLLDTNILTLYGDNNTIYWQSPAPKNPIDYIMIIGGKVSFHDAVGNVELVLENGEIKAPQAIPDSSVRISGESYDGLITNDTPDLLELYKNTVVVAGGPIKFVVYSAPNYDKTKTFKNFDLKLGEKYTGLVFPEGTYIRSIKLNYNETGTPPPPPKPTTGGGTGCPNGMVKNSEGKCVNAPIPVNTYLFIVGLLSGFLIFY